MQWRCSSRKVQKLKKINVITFENVCKFSSNLQKRYRCPVLSFLKFALHFIFLPFFISYLSGNKLRNLPQGIFKGLKRLLIMWVEIWSSFWAQFDRIGISVPSNNRTYQFEIHTSMHKNYIIAVLLIVFFSSVFRKRTLWKRTEERFHWQLPRNQAVKNSVIV